MTLMVIPWRDQSEEDVLRVRTLCKVAEAIFRGLLQAYELEPKGTLVGIYPVFHASLRSIGMTTEGTE